MQILSYSHRNKQKGVWIREWVGLGGRGYVSRVNTKEIAVIRRQSKNFCIF
jgi:hypothetical protein